MSGEQHKYLIFMLAGRRHAFDLAQVAEIVEQPVTWPIPLAPSCFRGAMNFHGTVVAVMDLAAFFGLASSRVTDSVVVLNTRLSALAFVVEDIVGIELPGQHGISSPSGSTAFAVGELKLPDGTACLLDAGAIAAQAAETINN